MILSPPWISILGTGYKARNFKGLLFPINYKLDKNRAYSPVTLLFSMGSIYVVLANELWGEKLRKVDQPQ